MKIIRDQSEWVNHIKNLNNLGIAGAQYEFQHIESPEEYPCAVETIVDDHPPGDAAIALVHCFFYLDDARALLRHTEATVVFDEEEGQEDERRP
jgi:hypothetical protein